MSYNSFDYYKQLREYQIHIQKVSNPEKNVPDHLAFKPVKPQIERIRQYQRNQKVNQIERENELILSKLVNINRRKHQISKSMVNLSLPPIKKQFAIPLYEQQNNKIAKRIIQSKPSIKSVKIIEMSKKNIQSRKNLISKYYNQDGMIINRKKYLAELMLLKKMRLSQVLKRDNNN